MKQDLLFTLKSQLNNLKKGNQPVCAYIENKEIDYQLLEEILSLSKYHNHWANFGPVSELLESTIGNLIKINQDKSVILCKSATQALHTLINMYEIKAERPLRWVISSFGFISTAIGTLSNAHIIDCDTKGILNIEQLKLLDIKTWDAVLITNTFGLCNDIKKFIKYCYDNNKILLIDNAMALLTETRKNKQAPCEVISFHQTKPWGIGEGGCAIVNSEDIDLFRSLLNFGIGHTGKNNQHYINGKLSDFDSALILQRLAHIQYWKNLYKLQEKRVHHIAIKCGLSPLSSCPENIIMGNLPFLLDHEISIDNLKNPWIVMHKYYKPLSKNTPNANNIYNRIINIPCHPQISKVSEKKIESAIQYIKDNSY